MFEEKKHARFPKRQERIAKFLDDSSRYFERWYLYNVGNPGCHKPTKFGVGKPKDDDLGMAYDI